MITQRFRSVVWVGGVALAALLLYIVSLQVATERGRLEELDRQVASTRREIRQLQTEMGTRANLRQLERWNGEVLALSAPGANQFLNGEGDISRIGGKNLGVTKAPPPAMASILMAEEQAMAAEADAVAAPMAAAATQLVTTPATAAKAEVAAPQLSSQDKAVQRAFGPESSATALATPPKSGGKSNQ